MSLTVRGLALCLFGLLNAVHTMAAAQSPLPPGVLTPPLVNMQVIFNFYDRRFPGFNGGREHLGVDLSAAAGTTVYAICDGVVASTNTDYAELVSAVVVVEHECDEPLGKVYGYYGHVHSVLLQNESVSAGAVIGTVRDWGWNSHLHFGLSTQPMEAWGVVPGGPTLQGLQDQGWLNPMNYFAATSVRPPPPQFKPVYRQAAPARPVARPTNAVTRAKLKPAPVKSAGKTVSKSKAKAKK